MASTQHRLQPKAVGESKASFFTFRPWPHTYLTGFVLRLCFLTYCNFFFCSPPPLSLPLYLSSPLHPSPAGPVTPAPAPVKDSTQAPSTPDTTRYAGPFHLLKSYGFPQLSRFTSQGFRETSGADVYFVPWLEVNFTLRTRRQACNYIERVIKKTDIDIKYILNDV